MEFFLSTLLEFLKENWYATITTLLAGGFLAKYVVVKVLVEDFVDYIKTMVDAKEDGVISDEEYADIGKAAEKFSMNLYARVKGLFTNKSKV